MLIEIEWFSWQVLMRVTFKTWVQVPGLAIPLIIFPCRFLCNASAEDHHARSVITIQASIRSNLEARIKGVCYTLSQRVSTGSKSQPILDSIGPKIPGLYLLIWGYPHPGLPSFLILLIFYLLFGFLY